MRFIVLIVIFLSWETATFADGPDDSKCRSLFSYVMDIFSKKIPIKKTIIVPEGHKLINLFGTEVTMKEKAAQVFERIQKIGEARNFEKSTKKISKQVRLYSEFKINDRKGVYVHGFTAINGSVYGIDIRFMNAVMDDNRKRLAIGVPTVGKFAGFAHTLYGLIKGAVLQAQPHPHIKKIRIQGSNIVNIELKMKLKEMGFESRINHNGVEETFIDIDLHK